MGFPKIGWSLQSGHGMWESILVVGIAFFHPTEHRCVGW